MKRASLGLALAATLVLGVSCDNAEREVSSRLQPLTSCGAVQEAIRQIAIDDMHRRMDENLVQALLGNSSGCWDGDGLDYANDARAPAPSAGVSQGESGGGAKQASGTNNQVAGVDEADFVKNDNKYIYILTDGTFRIIEAWPAAQSKEIARVEVEGTARKLFVQSDRALVYSSIGGSSSYRECTYGYACSFTGDGNPTKITIFDISDKTAPKLIRELQLSGSYLNARRIGDAVFTVVSSPGVEFPGLSYWPEGVSYCGGAAQDENPSLRYLTIVQAFERLRAANEEIIRKTQMKDWVPSAEDTIHVGPNAGKTGSLLGDCRGFYRSSIGDGGQFTTLLSLDIAKETTPGAATIVSRPGAVYASGEALYLSVPHDHRDGGGWFSSMRGVNQASTVHKFRLDPLNASARYAGSGVVKGRVLGQFSMDEKDGFLRVATSHGHVPSPDVHSTITVLGEQHGLLSKVGIVDNLAPKEDIRSVRFAGDRGYIVTFKKTDPLFVFDLSDPRSPKVLAELKIPGFSTYMHMMDENHLLTIGYDADDQGSFAWFTGVMLQIFDVSDPTDPRRTHKEVIGTRGSSSEALTNHLAFNYFAPLDLLAFPMTVCENGSGGGSYGTNMTFSGLMVYNVTSATGFNLRGKVAHPVGSGVDCSNWWTRATSQVKRSIIMDDYVFSISKDLIKVNHLDNLATDLVELPLVDE